MPRLHTRFVVLLAAAPLVATLMVALGGATATAVPSATPVAASSAATHSTHSAHSAPAPSRAKASHTRRSAERALARVERLLGPQQDAHSTGAPTTDAKTSRHYRDATLALRDLELRQGSLSAADQRRASRLLERPANTPLSVSNAFAIVHYTTTGVDASTAEYAQTVLDTVTHVHDVYVAAGYRVPKPDGVLGGDSRFDVYLLNLGTSGAYGYCTSDQQLSQSSTSYDRWAFCVLDNGFTEFPGVPLQILQVTTAHEYFHAVQYAYDSLDDGWFLEGTATWAEDYVYDDVNDNVQYLAYSPLASPKYSLDIFDQNGFRQYGAWSWFRWVSERFPDAQGGLPVIIREFWEGADSTMGNNKKRYSIAAIAKVLKAHGTPLPKAFATFAADNRRPAAFYSEAAALNYPTAPLQGKQVLSNKRRTSKTKTFKLDHLSSATTRFVPKKLKSKRYKLKLTFDLASKSAGSVVVVTSYLRDGGVKTKFAKLNGQGNGAMKVPFSTKKVTGVEVTLVNASIRYTNCYNYAITYSCYGKPKDQKQVEKVRGTVIGG